ncbi:MAG: hypothetical protein NVS2B5_15310 [Beijerinckiaceae bacterium]
MLKNLSAFTLLSLLAFSPTSAWAIVSCDAQMKEAEGALTKTTDAAKKEMAAKEVSMAKDMMAKKDEKGCMEHMDNAMKALR